eukprot:GHVR01148335.1.p1 GENE.GHVR01148335.1~~GHVR01148335.1.p1  ORF type:complete len:158 (+),score=20.92 GHVR01148335.1:379-852(+)
MKEMNTLSKLPIYVMKEMNTLSKLPIYVMKESSDEGNEQIIKERSILDSLDKDEIRYIIQPQGILYNHKVYYTTTRYIIQPQGYMQSKEIPQISQTCYLSAKRPDASAEVLPHHMCLIFKRRDFDLKSKLIYHEKTGEVVRKVHDQPIVNNIEEVLI